MTSIPFRRGILVAAISLTLAACASTDTQPDVPPPRAKAANGMSPALADAATRALDPNLPDRSKIYKGSGIVVKGQEPGGGLPSSAPVQAVGSAIVLNYEAADLREVIRSILGDILNASYTIDPAVGGQVTIRTTAGIPRDALPATLEMLLRMNGAAMIREEGIYKIVPQAAAVRGNVAPQLGNTQRALPPGFSVQIVPLRYVGVREMLRILEPFAKDQSAVRGDDTRNLLILAGTEIELRHLMDTVTMFDIDWMSGMSAGVFTLQNADVKTVMQELDKVLGDRNTSPLTGILRIIPIERMNALLVISPNAAYIEEAKKWIERLDAGAGEGTRFYVYNLQNQRAERIAPLLQQALTGRAAPQTSTPAPTLSPGTPAGTIVNPPAFSAQPTQNTPAPTQVEVRSTNPAGGTAARPGAAGGDNVGIARNVQVVADKDQNTILIVATPSEFSIVDQALRKLDVQSRQVMIDVTMAEVTLTDQLQFGVEWLFKGGAPSGRGSGGLIVTSPAFNPGNPVASAAASVGLGVAQGFSYIINNANFPGGVQAVLNLLDTYGNTRVVANPHLAALDNQKATIKAGDRIPINQQTYVGTGTGTTTNAVTTTSQYIDTGVLLQVIPHINTGGLVTLEVQAEVSIPGSAPEGVAPPINTRSVQTILAVPSGRTMVMGGLITTTKQNDSNGIPMLNRIPVLGGLFGKQTLKDNRTELVLFITPRVVDTELDYEGIMNDLRRKMEGLDRLFPGQPSWPAAGPTPSERIERFFAPKADPAPRPVPPGAVSYP